MFTVEHSLHLSVPVARVWRFLADVERYQHWHPFITMALDPQTPRKVMCTYRYKRSDYSLDGMIVELDRHHAIAWRIGIPGIIEIQEGFVIEKEMLGTHIVHQMRWNGFLAAIGWFSRNRLRRLLAVTDTSLAQYLQRGAILARYSQGRASRR